MTIIDISLVYFWFTRTLYFDFDAVYKSNTAILEKFLIVCCFGIYVCIL